MVTRVETAALPFNESHAFIIGIDDYRRLPKLGTAVNDAKKLAEVLAEKQGFNVYSPMLDATYEDILQLKNIMLEKVGPKDRVLFYFAGHGIALDGDERPEGYIAPVDACPVDPTTSMDEKSKLISMGVLHDAVDALPCEHVLLILDCCFSGAFKWSSRRRDIELLLPRIIYKERFDRFVGDPAWQVITSTAHDQKALDVLKEKPIGKRDEEGMNHSPFARALFKGLDGAADIIPADGGDGIITASELYSYLRYTVELQTIGESEKDRQTPGIFTLEKHDKGEYIFLNPKLRPDLPPIRERNPYKGLRSFEENDAALFFGRRRVVEELMEKVEERNLVVVSGASGAGKSSVVKAGLAPKLRKRGYTVPPPVRPGKNPTAALEKALDASGIFQRNVSLDEDMDLISRTLVSRKSVLIIDQFEELATQCHRKEERIRFIEILKTLTGSNPGNRFKLILTIRADFESRFKNNGFGPDWQKGRCTIPPFTVEELREIIVKPTVQQVFYIEPPELVDRIIGEASQAPGALPLLSFTMSELYRLYKESRRLDRVLRGEDYEKLGGVIGALHARADDLYNNLDPEQKKTMRKVLPRMASFDGNELAGKKAWMDELAFSEEEDGRVAAVLDQLLEARLILKDRDEKDQPYVEPAHDALIRGWEPLGVWIEKRGKDKILLQGRLGEAAKDYAEIKDENILWHDDPRLALLEKELETHDPWLNEKEAKFTEKSVRLRSRKKRKFITVLVSIIIVLSGLLAYSIYKTYEANNEARIARANHLTSQAQLRIREDPVSAMTFAERAYTLNKSATSMRVLSAAAATALEKPFYNVNIRHGDQVNRAVFSPSGETILTASSDGAVSLWDAKGNLLRTFQHPSAVFSAVFSPDGQKILTVSKNKSANMWDLQGKLLQRLEHNRIVNSAVFSPDGRFILTTSNDNTAKLWSDQGKLLEVYAHKNDLKSAAFSYDGARVLSVCNDQIAALWNLEGDLLHQINGAASAEFSPGSLNVLILSSENTVRLCGPDGAILKESKRHDALLASASFSTDGSNILTTYLGGEARLLDPDGRFLAVFKGHADSITSAVFSPDGDRILTGSLDDTAKLWDMNGDLIANFDKHEKSVLSAAFSPDGTKIITASADNTAKLWDLRSQPALNLKFRGIAGAHAAFSPKGDRILVFLDANTLQLMDVYGNLLAHIQEEVKINSAVFSPDGGRVLTASTNKTARLWDESGALLKEFDRHSANVNSAVFSTDGAKVLTASYDKTVKLWDVSGTLLANLDKHTAAVNSAVFSPDGRLILTASFDGTAKLWAPAGKLLTDFTFHYGNVESALFTPDGLNVLTISHTPRLWDLEGLPLAEFNGHGNTVTSAVFSRDGAKLLTASNDNTAKLWDMEGNLLADFLGHENIVYSAVFSPDEALVLTASADKTVKLWDLDGNIVSDFRAHKAAVNSAVFSPDGAYILSASSDKAVKLWLPHENIIEWLKTVQFPPLAQGEDGLSEPSMIRPF